MLYNLVHLIFEIILAVFTNVKALAGCISTGLASPCCSMLYTAPHPDLAAPLSWTEVLTAPSLPSVGGMGPDLTVDQGALFPVLSDRVAQPPWAGPHSTGTRGLGQCWLPPDPC